MRSERKNIRDVGEEEERERLFRFSRIQRFSVCSRSSFSGRCITGKDC